MIEMLIIMKAIIIVVMLFPIGNEKGAFKIHNGNIHAL